MSPEDLIQRITGLEGHRAERDDGRAGAGLSPPRR